MSVKGQIDSLKGIRLLLAMPRPDLPAQQYNTVCHYHSLSYFNTNDTTSGNKRVRSRPVLWCERSVWCDVMVTHGTKAMHEWMHA